MSRLVRGILFDRTFEPVDALLIAADLKKEPSDLGAIIRAGGRAVGHVAQQEIDAVNEVLFPPMIGDGGGRLLIPPLELKRRGQKKERFRIGGVGGKDGPQVPFGIHANTFTALASRIWRTIRSFFDASVPDCKQPSVTAASTINVNVTHIRKRNIDAL